MGLMLPFVEDDAARVSALRKLKLLDTSPQETFDRITRYCADIFNAPLGLLTLVDQERQWFLSSVGVAVEETPREQSFCNHAIASGICLAVEDAREDRRFATNSLVTGEPRIRSYLGQPVRGPSGHFLGALCIADTQPRAFDDRDRARLGFFASVVEDLIRAHSDSITMARLNKLLWREGQALKKSSQFLKQAEKVGGIGAWELDLKTGSLRFSDHMYALSGLAIGEPMDTKRALTFYHEEDRARVDEAIRQCAIEGGSFDYEASLVTFDSSARRIRCVGERLRDGNSNGAKVVGVMQDITEAYLANLALKRAADYDSLTGVYNRHAFDRSLREKIQEHRRTQEKLSLALVDLDGFKDINDTFGHVIGDVVLEEVSARILAVLGEGTILARWGGDEFALLPPVGSSLMEVSSLAEAAMDAVGEQIEVCGQRLQLSGTCGIAWFEEGMGTKELVRRADLALYEGKKRERGAIHYYHSRLELQNQTRQGAIAQVRAALDGDRVYAAYQPIIDLAHGSVIGFESLMRLNTRAGGKLTATEVLPALLDPVISRGITDRMLRSLCEDVPRLQAAHPSLEFVSLNVAEADLLSRGFAQKLLASLSHANVSTKMISLEVTETMLLVNDNGTVRRVLDQLHDEGVSIALDDFGTGFSSLSHLRDFPIDKVKIDCSFTQAMTADWQARTIVQALIAMAENMGIQVVAEGIETEEQRDLLTQMRCGLGQGFLFSPALDVGSVTLAALGNRAALLTAVRKAA